MVRMSTREEKWRRKGSHSSPEEEKKNTFWFNTFVMLFAPLGVLLIMKTLEDEWYIVIRAYKLTIHEILRYLSYTACLHYP